jgi:predicted nucleotidyltransferase
MKAVGVIVEYNPFHNGHALHLEESKKASGADVAIAAMSGNFLQRGEPALVSKWTRTKMALDAGVDVVFELPYQYATQQAEIFAYGGVSLLSSAGCESVCFGSEDGNIEAFQRTYDFLALHDKDYQERVKQHIQNGVSYPKALSMAFLDLSPEESLIDLSQPNNILGFHYLKAAKKLENPLKVLTVPRKSAGYHDEHFSSTTIASATSIRTALFSKNGQIDEILNYVPTTTFKILNEYKAINGEFHHWELYWPFLKYKLLQSSAEELRGIYEVEEGIENRLLNQVIHAESFLDFMNRVKTKRYTWTRIQRICLHVLTNTKKSEMNVGNKPVPYLRLLGMSEKGRLYLNKQKRQIGIPLISKLSSYNHDEITPDVRASKIYRLGLTSGSQKLNNEYSETPIYIPKKELL